MRYDPGSGPDAAAWLELDEQERITLAKRYHKGVDARVPNMQTHAIAHAVVETQLAEGHAPACDALGRLMKGGLDRHEAIHAIGAVLMRHVMRVLKAKQAGDMQAYDSELTSLTPEAWRREAGAGH